MRSKQIYYQYLFVIVVLFSVMQSISADNWTIRPSVEAGISNNDNIYLQTSNSDSETAIQIRPDLEISRKTEASAINLNLAIDSRQYSGSSVNDSDDVMINLNINKNTELSGFSLGSRFSRFSSLTSEVEDSGQLDSGQERDIFSVNPGYRYIINQKQSVRVGYSYSNVDYDAGTGSLVGYTNQGIDGTYTHQLSQKNTVDLTLNVYSYETDNNQIQADTVSFFVGTNYIFTETLSGRLSVGNRVTENTIGNVNFDSDGLVVNLNLTKKQAKTTYVFDVSRSISPSGAGQLNESDTLGLTLNHRFTKTISLAFNVKHIQNKSVLGFGSETDREYTSVSPALIWRFSEKMNINFAYRYAMQKYDSDTLDAESNLYRINVEYLWDPKQFLK